MRKTDLCVPVRPGRIFFSLTILLFGLLALPFQSLAQIQTQPRIQPQVQVNPAIQVPDDQTLYRLVWTTMIALDNANRTGNYSVLHALCSPEFQRNFTPDQIAGSFQVLRDNRADIGKSLFIVPTFYIPPAINSEGFLRLRGGFDYRPQSIRFDLLFSYGGNGWQIRAMSVVEMDANTPRN